MVLLLLLSHNVDIFPTITTPKLWAGMEMPLPMSSPLCNLGLEHFSGWWFFRWKRYVVPWRPPLRICQANSTLSTGSPWLFKSRGKNFEKKKVISQKKPFHFQARLEALQTNGVPREEPLPDCQRCWKSKVQEMEEKAPLNMIEVYTGNQFLTTVKPTKNDQIPC